ncbi:MAG: diguanylate cyclase [Bryobacteraceae bacterium]|nr:diguanylate cyclase [Bryobacterales bacterium]MEB2362656.1 diguanylate cyclase [Bryobacterales bacterium]NUN01100.1 diguanylate cyclase [Bryobacteraceae bacterium]
MRVLIAEDTIISRHLLEATLRKWGYDVLVACDGVQAKDILLREDSPRLAVLDWMMPGFTGPDLCKLVRQLKREPYTYILLLTSRSLKGDLIEGMEAGADDYLVKPFDEHELKVRLRAGRRIVELNAELFEIRESLREQATRDSLTGLWNRHAILEILARELERTRREAKPVGLIMLDLDHFKRINDGYGHLTGDQVLRESSARMQMSVRAYDAVGRYGGEEFLIVLPGCDAVATEQQAERIRRVIASSPIPTCTGEIRLTASVGATVAVESDYATNPERMLRTADLALYDAKGRGRNCVTFRRLHYVPEPEPETESFLSA